jgi:eukaryotic-like serine/threonine-protein kinase
MESQMGRWLATGEVVAGRYRVEHAIGEGGMGAVFAARDLTTDTPVAIKAILPIHAGNREVRTRFQREARVTAWLKSEHVARVLDSGELAAPATSTRAPSTLSYLVMERLDGRDLRSIIKEAGPLPLAEAVGYVRQACVALAEAHALGIVHRDLKPANLFIVRGADGAATLKLLDFGIAKFTSPNVAGDDIEMTGPSMMIGSRSYMSPEQMLDAKAVDARADVWALGVILFYLLTGTTPFEGGGSSDLALNILQGDPTSLWEVRPDLPPELDGIVRRCLEKLRDKRFANVVELSRALAPYTAQGEGTSPLEQLGSRTLELPGLGYWPAPRFTPKATAEAASAAEDTITTAPAPARRAMGRRRGWMITTAAIAAALTIAASAVAVAEGAGDVAPGETNRGRVAP